jgi:nitrogenase molybdenum-cofactor synthesis protein NifE
MPPARIAVVEEPGCAVDRARPRKERRGCGKRLQPGAAAGGCAFDGAKIALQPIADAAHLVHGPLACEGNSWGSRNSGSSGPTLYRRGFTTDLREADVVLGSGRKLVAAVGEIVARHQPAAVFVYATCVTALVGEELPKLCAEAQARFGVPVVPVESPGFAGAKNMGNELAGDALLRHVIGTAEPARTTPYDVNVIGEYNVAGELWQVKPLLDRLGIRILASISGDGRYRDVAAAHRARAALLVCSRAMLNLARRMEERWGIPFLEGSFYGVSDTSDALRGLAGLLVRRGAPADLLDRTEALVAAEERRAWARLEPFRARLAGKRVLLYTGGVKSWSVVSALQEIGMEVVGTSVRKSTEGDVARIRALMGDGAHTFDSLPGRQMYAILKEARADILLAGGRSQFVALKAKVPFLDVNQERHRGYAGYEGTVALVAEIDRALSSPVFREVRRPAPWDVEVAS